MRYGSLKAQHVSLLFDRQPRYTVIKLKWALRYRDLYTLYLLIRSDSAKVKKFDGIFSPALKV
jgi:hypothetical protein